jgi:dihydroorotate dehydrogenase electron transfer subunit
VTIKNHSVTVLKNSRVSKDISLLEFSIPVFKENPHPGQFFMIQVNPEMDPFLRRPYSIFDITKEGIKILVKIVGRGSKLIAEKKIGDTVEVLGPLGNGFKCDLHTHYILIAGGIGVAPLWFLAKRLQENSKEFSLIFGEKTATPLGEMVGERFGGKVFHFTDDGTRGIRSTVTGALPKFLKEHSLKEPTLFGCGPKEMLKELIPFGEQNSIPVYISLEENMACGIGVCLGCSVQRKGKKGFLTVCKDGPVFNGNEVDL